MVPVREIQDLLLLRGVNLTEQRFSGSSEVAIQTVVAGPGSIDRTDRGGRAQRIKRRVCEALVKYLSTRVATRPGVVGRTHLGDTQLRAFADPVRPIEVAGGCLPWTGSQRFVLTVAGAKGPVRVTVETNVRIIPPVVVAIRSLSRGDVIRSGDVD